ncbi:brachyurin [Culex quinquefasciatus]|uniref:brachyurin n=1 Tax=Culex quinquefasciatus TaxID=7176 RepID=UPI0018E3D035|nr:brachyurin [Culex quinquefasciatus]
MKNFVILIAILAVVSAKSVDVNPSLVQPFESIGIDWSQVQPIEDSDQYWDRLPADLQYLRKHQPDSRIVNGQEATPGQFPYQVFVDYQRNGGSYSCGGSILNSNHILTAAHCVWRAEGGIVIAGAHNRRIEEPTQQRIPFAKVYYHADYTEQRFRNDIAVVRLIRHITFNNRVQPVLLPALGDNRQFAGLTGTVSGFGRLCDDCDSSDVLMYTSNTIVSNAECLAVWGNPESIQDQNLCLSTAGETSTCQGDSGGPLTVMDGGRTMQVGIVSFGHSSGCVSKYPKVFARVTYYLDWILHVLTL